MARAIGTASHALTASRQRSSTLSRSWPERSPVGRSSAARGSLAGLRRGTASTLSPWGRRSGRRRSRRAPSPAACPSPFRRRARGAARPRGRAGPLGRGGPGTHWPLLGFDSTLGRVRAHVRVPGKDGRLARRFGAREAEGGAHRREGKGAGRGQASKLRGDVRDGDANLQVLRPDGLARAARRREVATVVAARIGGSGEGGARDGTGPVKPEPTAGHTGVRTVAPFYLR